MLIVKEIKFNTLIAFNSKNKIKIIKKKEDVYILHLLKKYFNLVPYVM